MEAEWFPNWVSERVLKGRRNSICNNTEATIGILNSLQEGALKSIT